MTDTTDRTGRDLARIELLRQRVQRGAKALDDHRPGWWVDIDLGTLAMSEGCLCVLGQLAGRFSEGVEMVHGFYDTDWAIDHGFLTGLYDCSWGVDQVCDCGRVYDHLQDAWVEAIKERWERG